MTTPKRIFIIGHLGALKSRTAEALAQKLGWQFIDANPSLERYIGRNLHDILGKQGEAAFHQCEGEILEYYKNKQQVVVVLEEGVVTSEENRKLLSDEYVVYLKVSISEQLARWDQGRAPLLPIADVKAFLEEQHNQRDDLYQALASISIDSRDVDENVASIMSKI